VPIIDGNELFARIREELELFLSPRRAAEVLENALHQIGSSPTEASFGHMVQIVDRHLRDALAAACEPEEAEELHKRVCAVLDDLAGRFFPTP
jgi:hypothetical protein